MELNKSEEVMSFLLVIISIFASTGHCLFCLKKNKNQSKNPIMKTRALALFLENMKEI